MKESKLESKSKFKVEQRKVKTSSVRLGLKTSTNILALPVGPMLNMEKRSFYLCIGRTLISLKRSR